MNENPLKDAQFKRGNLQILIDDQLGASLLPLIRYSTQYNLNVISRQKGPPPLDGF
jgi:hypothetical protein